MKIYPWQQPLFDQLLRRYESGRLPHALLFTGPRGLGKAQFAQHIAQTILCEQESKTQPACGVCKSCRLFDAGTHPDMRTVSVPDDKVSIGIDQARDIGEFITLKTQFGGHKVVIIDPADFMNRNAANSFLKNLEEPSGDSLIILITDRPGHLLPTIRSRCQTISFPRPDRETALSWLSASLGDSLDVQTAEAYLDMARGAPLAALALARENQLEKQKLLLKQLCDLSKGGQEPVSMAQAWSKSNVPTYLAWMAGWISDIIRLKFAGDFPLSKNRDISHILQGFARQTEAQALFRFLDRLNNAARFAEGQKKHELLMEDAVICWQRLFRRRQQHQP